ncbi:MAG: hypothetical protein M3141_07475 [Actinomycetota bacterium]|nr:hypothetical protein [Actinomycetota bacterium]
MDLGDLLGGIFSPAPASKRAGRLERVLSWGALVGIVLIVGFVWLAYSGF